MDDESIIALYWHRDENAIYETSVKYGKLCRHIAGNILSSREDCEECVNDTYLGVWNAIPEQHTARFPAFIGRITRNLALKRYDYLTAAKRSSVAVNSLEELDECVSGSFSVEDEVEARRVERLIDSFLLSLDDEHRTVFVRRYWYLDSINELSAATGYSQGRVKNMLAKTRRALRGYLESEGVEL